MKRLAEYARYVMQVVRGLGFDPTESSRLAQMRDILSRKEFILETDQDFEVACEAQRDLTMLKFAFDQLSAQYGQQHFRDKARLIVQDLALPQNCKDRTPGRDAQTELYIAGVCQAAGLKPRSSEPDIVVDFNGQVYGLAVKRLKNLKRLEEHFKKAVSQIGKSRIPGFVVLDLAMAANRQNTRFPGGDEDFSLFEKERFSFLQSYTNKFKDWRKGQDVRGVLVLDLVLWRLDQQGRWAFRQFEAFLNLDPLKQSEAKAFFETFKQGIPDLAN